MAPNGKGNHILDCILSVETEQTGKVIQGIAFANNKAIALIWFVKSMFLWNIESSNKEEGIYDGNGKL